jgi:IS30 family transposase
MTYQQLTLDERYQIQALLKCRQEPSGIAEQLGRHRSTLYRELQRNSDSQAVAPYLAARAQRRARARRVVKGAASRKIHGKLKRLVEQKLRLSWSPEQISGRLRLELGVRISHETIYQHVLRDTHERKGVLRYCLRFGGYKHHRFKKSRMAERTRLRKNWLAQRPTAANDRSEIGHWERDCVLGKRGNSALLTVIDRRSRYTRLRHVRRLNCREVSDATVDALSPYREINKTITNDNGMEFQRDESLHRRLRIPIFFTEPASPWQRGSVENANGLVRQYLPKSSNLDKLPRWSTLALEETLNYRPRKILDFRTPHEVFFGSELRLTSKRLMRLGLEFSKDV